jgi:hypothetical protein
MILWLLSRPLPFYTSLIGLVLAITTTVLLRRKSKWGFISNAVQTGSWLIVGPLTGQWFYMVTGVILPVMNWNAFRKWKREEGSKRARGADEAAQSRDLL